MGSPGGSPPPRSHSPFAAVSSLPSGSQPGSPAGPCCGHEVHSLEQLPHCLQPWGSAACPARPRRWPRGAESVPSAGGVTSALAGTLGWGPQAAACTCLLTLPRGGWPAARPGLGTHGPGNPLWSCALPQTPAGAGSLPHGSLPLPPGLAGCPCQGSAQAGPGHSSPGAWVPGWGEAAAPGRAECAAAWLYSGGQVGALGTLSCWLGAGTHCCSPGHGPTGAAWGPYSEGPCPPRHPTTPREQGGGRCVGRGPVSLFSHTPPRSPSSRTPPSLPLLAPPRSPSHAHLLFAGTAPGAIRIWPGPRRSPAADCRRPARALHQPRRAPGPLLQQHGRS